MRIQFSALGVMLLLLPVLFLVPSVSAASTSFNGPLIQLIVCPQAEYDAGATATCAITLKNSTSTDFDGRVDFFVWQGSTKILALANEHLAIAAGATWTLSETFTLPTKLSPRGFLLTAHAVNSAGALIDSASGYIESASSYLIFPRPATIGNPVTTIDKQAQLTSWLAYGINLPIYFDIYYKAHIPAPPHGVASWKNLEGMSVQRSVVNDFVNGAHAAKMGIYMLQDWFAANDDWSTDGSGMKPEWAIFNVPCKTPAHPAPCTIWDGTATKADQWAQGDNWKAYGWKTNNLPVFDPTNQEYVAFFISHVKDLYDELGLDGLWIDTLGDLGSHVYRADGSPINNGRGLGSALVDFTNAVIAGTGRPAYINNVDFWQGMDIASRSNEPFIYSEIWSSSLHGPNSTPLYTSINAMMARYRSATMKPVVFPAYLNDSKRASPSCVGAALMTPCYTNAPSAHYLTSQILASGAYHMVFEENDTMDAGPYFVQGQLHMTSALIAAELDLQHFGIAYEDILRDQMVDSRQMCEIVATDASSPRGDYGGSAGHVYTLPKSKPGVQVCHLLNRSALSDNHWKDDLGTYPAAPVFHNVTVKAYYTGVASRVWLASPDVNHGEPRIFAPQDYTVASDAAGTYAQVIVPSLEYWTMIVIEGAH